MAPFMSLPNELIDEIFDHLLNDPNDGALTQNAPTWRAMNPVVSLASTCRRLHHGWSPVIYHHASALYPSLLFWACEKGQTRLVRELLSRGCNPNRPLVCTGSLAVDLSRQPMGQRAADLFNECDGTNIQWSDLLQQDQKGILHEPYHPDTHGGIFESMRIPTRNPTSNLRFYQSPDTMVIFPIHFAVRSGHLAVVQELINGNALVEVPSYGPWIPRPKLFPLRLVETGGWFYTPVHFAIASQNTEIIGTLMEAGSVFSEQGHRATVFHSAAAYGTEDTIDFLLEKFKTLTIRPSLDDLFTAHPLQYPRRSGHTPMFHAHLCQNWSVIDHLVRRGADVDGGAADDYTPLIAACITGNVELGRQLIDHGADVNVIVRGSGPSSDAVRLLHGLRPIDVCSQNGQPDSRALISLLIEAGAAIERSTPWNASHMGCIHDPIIAAAACHQPAILCELLSHGGNPNRFSPACPPGTPLMAAIVCCPPGSEVEWLQNPSPGRYDGMTLAACGDRADGVQEPEGRGIERMMECISLLLQAGADPNQLDYEGKTVFDRLADALDPDVGDHVNQQWPKYCQRSCLTEETVLKVALLLLTFGCSVKFTKMGTNCSFLGFAFMKCSADFCHSIFKQGAYLLKQPDEYKECWDMLLIQPYALAPDDRMAMINHHGDPWQSYSNALNLFWEMDMGCRLGREPYFLARALGADCPDGVAYFIIEKYIEQFPNMIQGVFEGRSMFSYAINNHSPNRLKALLARCPNPSPWLMASQELPLLSEAILHDSSELTLLLLRLGFAVHHAGDGQLPDLWPTYSERRANGCTEVCIEWHRSSYRVSPVARAVHCRKFNILEVLLNNEYLSWRVPAQFHFAYITVACSTQQLRMLKLLLRAGADPNAKNPETGDTPLLSLLRRMDVATAGCIRYEVKENAPVQLDEDLRVWLGRWVSCVSILLKENGSTEQVDKDGISVVYYISKILEYQGSTWFRVCLKLDAGQRWRVREGEDDSSSTVEVLEDKRVEKYLRSEHPPSPTYERLMTSVGADPWKL